MEIQNQAEEILQKHNLTFISGSVRGEITQRAYVAFAKDSRERKYVLKMLLVEKKIDRDDFLTEESFLRAVKKNPSWNLFDSFPQYLDSDIEKMPHWLLMTAAPGEPAGDIMTDFGWKERNLVPQAQVAMVNFLAWLHSVSEKEARLHISPLEVPDFITYFLDSFTSLRSDTQDFIGQSVLTKIQEIFNNNLNFLSKPRLVLTHSDLYPKNAFLTNDYKLTIIDVDRIMLCNPGLDAAFFWVMGWQKPDWQKDLEEKLVRKVGYSPAEFLRIFHLMVIYLSVRLISHGITVIPSYKKQRQRGLLKQARKSIEAHKKNIETILKKEK